MVIRLKLKAIRSDRRIRKFILDIWIEEQWNINDVITMWIIEGTVRRIQKN